MTLLRLLILVRIELKRLDKEEDSKELHKLFKDILAKSTLVNNYINVKQLDENTTRSILTVEIEKIIDDLLN